ncbi:ABC transporter permease subunit [Rudaeicoccus suwonensis]|uniref:Simple sugar transport system permease protein n=1 Tax=Rudaeicoccus suwonensis TaxID=657409 RepID=A0A561E8V3_9MICO|nr:ABC transporter permease [Rudaeicoccus suwonensis]TWE12039.1 simple sugar transport system permease protein [Rudaeicoccus suwonensis]
MSTPSGQPPQDSGDAPESTTDTAAGDNAVTDNAVTDNAVTDNAVTDNAVTDNAVTDNAVTDNAVTDNAVTDNAVTDNAVTDNAVTDNAVTDNAVTDNAVTDNAVTDNAVTDNAVTDNAVTDNAVTDNAVTDNAAEGTAADGTTAQDTGVAEGAVATSEAAEGDSLLSRAEARSGDRTQQTILQILRSDHPAIVTVLAVICAMIVGAILIVVSDTPTRDSARYFFADPGATFNAAWWAVKDAYVALFEGAIYNPSGTQTLAPLSETLVYATPLILAGLSVALAFRAGLFNIGAQGQILMSAALAGYIGFAWHLPAGIHIIVAIIGGIIGGAIWAGIAGLLKARTGAHEVITTIMLNYVAVYFINYLLAETWFQAPPFNQAVSRTVAPNAQFWHLFGSDLRVNFSFVLAIAATVFVWWLLKFGTFGFRLRAVGANQNAARTAGISTARTYIWVMVIVGALAGLAGVSQILGVANNYQVTASVDGGVGFTAITVALLGRGGAWGTFWAGLLFGALTAGSSQLQVATATPPDLVQVLQALVVLFIAAPGLIRLVFRLRKSESSGSAVLAKGWNG